MSMDMRYLCIDLKSFYASCECVARGLDPNTTPLVVADARRGRGALCLAVSPALKAHGVRNRCRLYEIPAGLHYWIARPRMASYIAMSADIYGMYLDHFAPEDIHVYSIDEAFIDASPYLRLYGKSCASLAQDLLSEMTARFGLTATAGIGSNLFLAKVALDILAKHDPSHCASLDEERYRSLLWDHRPLQDFWQMADGTASRLAMLGITTMRGLANADREALSRLLGSRAEVLRERAWGREAMTLAAIRAQVPSARSLSSSQILPKAYDPLAGEIIIKEIAELLALELVKKGEAASGIALAVGYEDSAHVPSSHTSHRFASPCRSPKALKSQALSLYRLIVRHAPVRRLALSYTGLCTLPEQEMMLLPDEAEEKEQALYGVLVLLRERHGAFAAMRALDLEAGATMRERSHLIGGHEA